MLPLVMCFCNENFKQQNVGCSSHKSQHQWQAQRTVAAQQKLFDSMCVIALCCFWLKHNFRQCFVLHTYSQLQLQTPLNVLPSSLNNSLKECLEVFLLFQNYFDTQVVCFSVLCAVLRNPAKLFGSLYVEKLCILCIDAIYVTRVLFFPHFWLLLERNHSRTYGAQTPAPAHRLLLHALQATH